MNNSHLSDRKKDHIDLALNSQTLAADERFYYEPILNFHNENSIPKTNFCGKILEIPFWVSSMTGGTEKAHLINHQLAKACHQFGMGMGLGSCRIILENNSYFQDFDVRNIIGEKMPLFANLGIAQLEEIFEKNEENKVIELVQKLNADGLIIHVNPLQELLQPEGDRFKKTPLETIEKCLSVFNFNIIVKEVGQGMGKKSLETLLQFPLEAIEFGAFGGTNFSSIELNRQNKSYQEQMKPLSLVGHQAFEMLEIINTYYDHNFDKIKCKNIIISGGINNVLDAFYLLKKSKMNTIIAQASGFLKHISEDYKTIEEYCNYLKTSLNTCYNFLTLK